MSPSDTDINDSKIAVRMTKTYHWFALLGIAILPLSAIFFGGVRHQTPLLVGGVVGILFIAGIGWLTLRSTPVLMEISNKGIYVRQYKRHFGWQDIKRVYVIDMAERMSATEQAASVVAGNPSLRLAMLIGLEFTESGLQKYGILADALWQRQHDDHAVIRTHLFTLGNCVPDLIHEAERMRVANS